MNQRSADLLRFRPEIPNAKITPEISRDERFQNAILRPVIKFQNELLIAALRNHISKHKGGFYELSTLKRLEYIENAIQRDVKFRNALKGMIIGQFTVEEYEIYIKNSSALNKRMMNLVTERLKDQVLLFEIEVFV